MLLPTASTCSPSITFLTLHTVDIKGLNKFNECLKETFKYHHYDFEESTLIVVEQPSNSYDISDFSWINKDISLSTIRSNCDDIDVVTISDEEPDKTQNSTTI